MLQDGLVLLHERDGELRSFTKVRGNENNARAVIQFVLEASGILRKTMYLHDEGDALYCPLLILNGLAKPEESNIREHLEYWNGEKNADMLHNGGPWDVSTRSEYFEGLLADPPDWGAIQQYIRPFKDGGEFETAKPFKTIKLNMEDAEGMANLPNLISNLINEERSESDQYYDSVKTFPQ